MVLKGQTGGCMILLFENVKSKIIFNNINKATFAVKFINLTSLIYIYILKKM